MPRSLFIIGLVAVVGAIGIWTWNLVPTPAERAASSPAATIGGPFTLVNHLGKTVTEAFVQGRTYVIEWRRPNISGTVEIDLVGDAHFDIAKHVPWWDKVELSDEFEVEGPNLEANWKILGENWLRVLDEAKHE